MLIAHLGSKVLHAKAAKQLSLMMAITMITQVIAVYKSSVTAANFGASTVLDAYNFGNNIASFFLSFISSGVVTVILPAYVKKTKRSSIDTFVSTVFLLTLILLLLSFLFRNQIVDLFSARENEFKDYVSRTLLLSILIQTLPAILSVTTAYYQSADRFNLPKIILMASNLAVAMILGMWKDFTIYEYLYVLLGGAALQAAVDIAFALCYGFRFRLTTDLHDRQFRKMCQVFLPTVFGTGIYAVNTIINSLLASNLGTGQLTVLSYANMIVGMVNTMVIGNLTAYVFPRIVRQADSGKERGQSALFGYAIIFHAAVGLLVAGFLGVGREFIGMLYERGKFTAAAADSVYICMGIYIIGQQANIVRDLFYRYFFASGDTKSTTRNGLTTSCLNIVLSLILSFFFGLYGIVCGTLISGVYSMVGIYLRFKKKYGLAIETRVYMYELLKTTLAVILTAGVVFLLKMFYRPASYPASFLVFGMITAAVFCLSMLVFKTKVMKMSAEAFDN